MPGHFSKKHHDGQRRVIVENTKMFCQLTSHAVANHHGVEVQFLNRTMNKNNATQGAVVECENEACRNKFREEGRGLRWCNLCHDARQKNDDGKSSHQRGFWLPWTFRADKDSTLITCVEIANKATKEKKGEVATEIVNGETGETVDCKMPALSANAKDEDDKQSDNESDDEKFAAI